MVVIPHQDQVEVFANNDNSVSIKQTDAMTNEQVVIAVHPQNISALIKALRQAAKDAVQK